MLQDAKSHLQKGSPSGYNEVGVEQGWGPEGSLCAQESPLWCALAAVPSMQGHVIGGDSWCHCKSMGLGARLF